MTWHGLAVTLLIFGSAAAIAGWLIVSVRLTVEHERDNLRFVGYGMAASLFLGLFILIAAIISSK